MRTASQWFVLFLALILCQVAIQGQGIASQESSAPKRISENQAQQQAMQALAAAAKPGPPHALLMKRAGHYTFTMIFYPRPDAEPEESTGTATLEAILGGRFLEEVNAGETDGQPTSGMRLYGYNNGSKQYEAVWIYDGSTAILVLNGTSNDNGKTVRYTGAFLGPDGKPQTLHVTVEQIDDDHFTVRMIGEGPPDSAPVVETTYTRKNVVRERKR
jgi:hypothetical protein